MVTGRRTGALGDRHAMTLLLSLLIATRAGGQEASGARFVPSVMAVGELTTASPALFGRRYTEAYLAQPNAMADAGWGALRFWGTLNFEGYTLRRGELNAGMYGEGYADRRHPHTLVHEAMFGVASPAGHRVRLSLAGGKGFTPYGTDDPMMRPFVKYPVNHHHAQIIERVQTVAAVGLQGADGTRRATIEAGWFNGDEPMGPFLPPRWSRFGDSHAVRATVSPGALELQASRAFVKSPGFVRGGAFDHHQTSVSLRYQRNAGDGAMPGMPTMPGMHHGSTTHEYSSATGRRPALQYALAEVARTDEGEHGVRAFRYESALAEASVGVGGVTVSLRGEQSERPESERLLDPFRIANGHIDFQIVGVTRWRIGTVSVAAPSASLQKLAEVRAVPFVEASVANAVARRRPAVFEPREFYGAATQWSVSVGVRVHAGHTRARMGRYSF